MFHAINGLYFDRRADGSVVVSHWLRGAGNAGRADQTTVNVLDREWRLTASEWASVLATVSARGESASTHGEALLFHEKGDGSDA